MRHAATPLFLAMGVFALAACQPQSPAGDENRATTGAAPAAGSGAEAGVEAEAGIDDAGTPGGPNDDGLAPPSIMSPSDVDPTSGPSFDCSRASSSSEKMVCADPALAALDRELEALYDRRLAASSGADLDRLKAMQRGWVKGRDECGKAEDTQRCVREAYQTRLVELQIDSGEVMVPSPVEFVCDDDRQPFTATFYNDIEPRAAVLTLGNDQAIAIAQPTASGSRYAREGVEFREHQGEATVDFYGTRLSCRAAR